MEPQKLDAFSAGRALWKRGGRASRVSSEFAPRRELMAELHRLIETRLTPRQRDCVRLYFFEGRTLQEVADELGISRRVVSQHLFGIRRDGRQVGGALKRIRKLCDRYGVRI